MKFFTRQWCTGELSDEVYDAVPAAYQAHLLELLPSMPATVRAFAQGVDIHDGLLRGVSFDRARAILTISMRCGDLQVGYFDLDIVYSGVGVREEDSVALRDLGRNPQIEALYDEVDRSRTGAWVHRILFSDYREVRVAFERLGMRLEPMPNRQFERKADVYVELPAKAV